MAEVTMIVKKMKKKKNEKHKESTTKRSNASLSIHRWSSTRLLVVCRLTELIGAVVLRTTTNDTPRCGEVSRIPSPKVNKLQNRLSIADKRGHTEAVLERLFFGSQVRATRIR